MSDNNNQTSVRQDSNMTDLPVAAIVCLSVGGYVILVMIFLIIRRTLVSKGLLDSSCCCPESLPACCACVKIKELCQSCCGGCCREGCLMTVCGFDKEIKCKDIFCCCFTCQKGCCDSCSDVCTTCLYSCCHPKECCPCGFYCPPCFGNDLDPDACGCLCLEIKLRTAHRSSSAPPRGSQNQNVNVDLSVNGVSSINNMYHTGQINGNILDKTLEEKGIGNGSIRERRRSSSHSPTKAAAHFSRMLPGKLNAFDALNIPEGQNSERVLFTEVLEESLGRREFRQYLSSSAVLSSSAPGGLFARSSIERAGSSEIEPNHRSVSRSRRLIRPGQISQRFPNKILVTSESLQIFSSLEKEKTVVSEVALIENNKKPFSNVTIHHDGLNLSRPLPAIKRTV